VTDFLWWRDGVIYQIYPRSFKDSNGDGIGDLSGVTDRIEYLADLGVDAIWLSPIYPSPMFDFGYDVADYESIDPVFGDLHDFDRLLEKAHLHKIRVVMDLVLNHTSHLHPWFVESRSSRNNPKRDWYLWRDPGPRGGPPNNWQSIFGGKAWEFDKHTGQYYYHQFLKQQPDLNWRNTDLRERVYEVLRFWLDRGVDGFRLDVVMSYFKDAQFRSNPRKWIGLRGFDRQIHLYDWNQADIQLALHDIRSILDAYPDRMAVGEVTDPEMAVSYIGRDKLHLAFNFDFLRQPWKPEAFLETILDYQQRMPPEAWPSFVLGNHDVSRFPSRFGGGKASDARTKVGAAMLLTQRGTPFIYYGEEIGMLDTPIPYREIQDPPGRRYWPFYRGRDPARTPMQWDDSSNAGFSMGTPWLRVNKDYRVRNVAKQAEDPGSVLNFYKRMLRLRRESTALQNGDFKPLKVNSRDALVYLRESQDQTFLVALNFGNSPLVVTLDVGLSVKDWSLKLSSTSRLGQRLSGNRLDLAPFEAAIFKAGN